MSQWKALIVLVALTATAHAAAPAPATAPAPCTRIEDVVYGRSYGTALTLDVMKPTANANGAGVILVVSGGWVSSHLQADSRFIGWFAEPLTRRGYTVFAVYHGCQPKFQIPEIVQNINRATRFIRAHAREYGVDPDRIAITGGSAGGHLSLMQGLAPSPPNPDAKDPIERVEANVQAVACFFPPTDFFNYGREGENALGVGILENFKAAFDFHELDPKTRVFVPITDEKRRNQIGRDISPAYHVTADDPPTLIIHGDADKLVPIQQAQLVIDRLNEANVPAKLVVKEGAGHGWPDVSADMEKIADWFDQHLNHSGK